MDRTLSPLRFIQNCDHLFTILRGTNLVHKVSRPVIPELDLFIHHSQSFTYKAFPLLESQVKLLEFELKVVNGYA